MGGDIHVRALFLCLVYPDSLNRIAPREYLLLARESVRVL
jgi:hypothetical protein